MTRATLTVIALLLAGASSIATGTLLGVPQWWALPVVPLTFFALVVLARRAHRGWVRRIVTRETRAGRDASEPLRSLDAAGRLHLVAAGKAGFSQDEVPCPALERAVLMPWPAGDEAAVREELRRMSPATRARLVSGLRELQGAAVAALGSPLHVLFPEAHRILGVTGVAAPLFLAFRARRAWAVRRKFLDPDAAATVIAVRLLRAGMPEAALQALAGAPIDARAARVRQLARFLALLEGATDALTDDDYRRFGRELVLLLGRRLRELVPGSQLLAAVPGGAMSLERTVGGVDTVVNELCTLHGEVPELAPQVRHVLARLLDLSPARLRVGLKRGRLAARPDTQLQAHLRGLALLAEGRPDEALAEFEAGATEGGPLAVQAAYCAACAAQRIGRDDDPARSLREVVQRQPEDPAARLFLARFLADNGDESGARAVYEGALGSFPDAIPLRVAYAQDLLGWGDAPTARRHLETVHRRHPRDPRLAFLAGRARVAAGRPKDAVAPLVRACEALRGVERAEAQFWLLAAYRDQGSHDRALELADALVDGLGASQVGFLDELADYFEERHEFLRARRAEERARRLRGEW